MVFKNHYEIYYKRISFQLSTTQYIGMVYLLVAQMLEEIAKDFEGLYLNAFTLGGHELVDYPGNRHEQ